MTIIERALVPVLNGMRLFFAKQLNFCEVGLGFRLVFLINYWVGVCFIASTGIILRPRGKKFQICRRIFPLSELLFPEMGGLFPVGVKRLRVYSPYRDYPRGI